MTKEKKFELDNMLDFIFSFDPAESGTDESLGISEAAMTRFNSGVSKALENFNKRMKKSWIKTGAEKRSKFQELLKDKVSKVKELLDRESIINAIRSGELGLRLQTQFRNRTVDMLSDEELTVILEDQELLLKLSKIKENDVK